MTTLRLLLDSNVIFQAEDPNPVPLLISDLYAALNRNGVEVFVHEATQDDIMRDRDEARRSNSLNKFLKYPMLRKPIVPMSRLVAEFGPNKNENDESDAYLLFALHQDAADILVTRDAALFKRAERSGLGPRVLSPRQAIDFLGEGYAQKSVAVQYIQDVECSQLDRSDDIFDSLRGDYSGFDAWFTQSCRKGRRCWVVRDVDGVAGLVIYKRERPDETDIAISSEDALKLCTFKIAEGHRGGRLGELFLRQALWFCHDNRISTVYLTAFDKQSSLIDLLEYYGFEKVGKNSRGEWVIARRRSVALVGPISSYDRQIRRYPEVDLSGSSCLIVPIKPEFHARLFPESYRAAIGETGLLFTQGWQSSDRETLAVGTAIRKVYVTRSKLLKVRSGEPVAFYYTSDHTLEFGQSVVAVGVVERLERYSELRSLFADTAKRTVYSRNELAELLAGKDDVGVLFFAFVGYLREPVTLATMIDRGILQAQPQSLMHVTGDRAESLLSMFDLVHAPSG